MSYASDIIKGQPLGDIDTYTTDCTLHSDGCWGFFALRTTHEEGDDERIAAAMQRLDDAVDNIISLWRQIDGETTSYAELAAEVRSRYHTVLIQDPVLQGASLDQARAYFQIFATPYIADTDEDGYISRTPRFRAFILVDEQVLSNLETFPVRGDLESLKELQRRVQTEWVKLVDTDNYGEEGTIAVRASHFINAFSSMCSSDHGLEEFIGDDNAAEGESDIWTFYGL